MDRLQVPISLDTLASHKNDPLPAALVLVARPWLLRAERDLAHIDQEIQALQARRSALIFPLDAYRVALAPHKSLTDDVLREIFILSAYQEGTQLETDLNMIVDRRSSKRRNIRLIISAVSSRWRSVALETHELWSKVDVQFPYEEPHLTNILDVLNIWLSRTGNYPLSFRFNVQVNDVRIVELLFRFLNQIRSLSFESHWGLGAFLDSPPGSMGRLETLRLGNDEWAFEHPRPITVFGEAPCLRSVSMTMVPQGTVFQGLQWHQLGELKLQQSFLPSDFYLILDQCKALESASIDIFGAGDLGGRDVSFPQLRSLHVVSQREWESVRLLRRMSLPSIVDLKVDFDYSRDPLIDAIPLFPTLQCIHLLGPSQDLSKWLQAYSSVLEVNLPPLNVWDLDDVVLDQIAEGSLLPNTTLLTMCEAKPTTILAMLEARLASETCSTITHVTLARPPQYEWDLTVDQTESLIKLMEAGIFVAYCSSERPTSALVRVPCYLIFGRRLTSPDRGRGASPVFRTTRSI